VTSPNAQAAILSASLRVRKELESGGYNNSSQTLSPSRSGIMSRLTSLPPLEYDENLGSGGSVLGNERS